MSGLFQMKHESGQKESKSPVQISIALRAAYPLAPGRILKKMFSFRVPFGISFPLTMLS